MLFLTFSALVTRKKLLYTVANPARGLLNREKKKKKREKSGSAPPPPPRARCSFGGKKRKRKRKIVNNGIWSFLDYVEDIAAGRLLPPSFKSLTRTFCLYCYIYFIPLVFTY